MVTTPRNKQTNNIKAYERDHLNYRVLVEVVNKEKEENKEKELPV